MEAYGIFGEFLENDEQASLERSVLAAHESNPPRNMDALMANLNHDIKNFLCCLYREETGFERDIECGNACKKRLVYGYMLVNCTRVYCDTRVTMEQALLLQDFYEHIVISESIVEDMRPKQRSLSTCVRRGQTQFSTFAQVQSLQHVITVPVETGDVLKLFGRNKKNLPLGHYEGALQEMSLYSLKKNGWDYAAATVFCDQSRLSHGLLWDTKREKRSEVLLEPTLQAAKTKESDFLAHLLQVLTGIDEEKNIYLEHVKTMRKRVPLESEDFCYREQMLKTPHPVLDREKNLLQTTQLHHEFLLSIHRHGSGLCGIKRGSLQTQ